jgi:uncharacterized membrane protein HdeD (DUF308 family)
MTAIVFTLGTPSFASVAAVAGLLLATGGVVLANPSKVVLVASLVTGVVLIAVGPADLLTQGGDRSGSLPAVLLGIGVTLGSSAALLGRTTRPTTPAE